MTQVELFEPKADECGPLASLQLRKADQFNRAADVFAARGWDALERDHRARARQHEDEAECLAMYAQFLRFAGVAP